MTSSLPLAVLIVSAVVNTVSCGLMLQFNASLDINLPKLLNAVVLTAHNDVNFFLTSENYEPSESAVSFWCGNRKNPELRLTLANSYDIEAKINTNKPVMFIVHGWTENHTNSWVQDTVRDSLIFLDVNVCAVDWADLAHYEYSASVNHTLIVSDETAKFINILVELNVPPKSITLVGHGLGAQISGQVGYRSNSSLGQIFGLDPAGASFTTPPGGSLSFRLDKSDAEYVQFIITAKGTASVAEAEGHENFYINGGSVPQPNCGSVSAGTGDVEFADIMLCSHFHAYTLFRLSMNPLLVYPARLCRSWTDFLTGRCFFNRMTRMGIYSTKQGGDFYLKTTAKAPFNLF